MSDLGTAAGWIGKGTADYGGMHMEDWTGGAAPWLKSIQAAAGVAAGVAGTVSVAAGPYGMAASTGLNMVLGSISDGIDAYDSQKVVAHLIALRDRALPHVQDPQAKEDLGEALAVAIKKKTRHRNIAIGQAASLQTGRIATTAYRTARAMHKKRAGTKGVSRGKAADTLLKYKSSRWLEGEIARTMIFVLAKQNFDDLLKSTITEAFRS